MSITDVSQVYEGRSAKRDLTTRNYSEVWQVLSNDPSDGPKAALDAVTVGMRDAYPDDSLAVCINKDVAFVSGGPAGNVWRVTVEYASHVNGKEVDSNADPTDRTPIIHWGVQPYEIVLPSDVDGVNFINSAGDPFEDIPSQTRYYITLAVQRIEASFSASLPAAYNNRLNSGSFAGSDPETALCVGITGDKFREDGSTYWTVTYNFIFNIEAPAVDPGESPFTVFVLDAGFNYIDTTKKPFLSGIVPVTTPQLLDAGSPTSSPRYIAFHLHEAVDFDSLSLPV